MALAEKLVSDLPGDVAGIAMRFFKESFANEGFTDNSFIAWPKRKDAETHKILTRSQALQDSIEVASATKEQVHISAGKGLPYGNIHNTGGIIKVRVTKKARRFFWYMYKQTEDEKWKWMALTKKEHLQISIPQRQFIGESATLLKNIDEYIIQQIIKRFKNIK